MKIRNSGWDLAPKAMLDDQGLFYLIDFRVATRRIYKSSIDKEYELHLLAGLLLLPLIIIFKIVTWTVLLAVLLLRKF
jgi:hypothetical protein